MMKSFFGSNLTFIETLCSRGIGAFGSILLGIILGRLLGATGLGIFSIIQSVLLGSAIFARFGMDNALMRYIGMSPESAAISVYLKMAVKRALLYSMLIAFLGGITIAILGDEFSHEMQAMLKYLLLAVPAMTGIYLMSGFMKGVGRPAAACLLESGYISLITGCLLLGLYLLYGTCELVWASLALVIACWLVFLQGAIQVFYSITQVQMKSGALVDADAQEFMRSSKSFFIMSLAEFMQNIAGVLIAGTLLSSAELGLFKSAERIALVIGFTLMLISAIYPPKFARAFYDEDLKRLKIESRKSSFVGLCISLPLLLVCLIFPSELLKIFGDEFIQADTYLRILALAQTFNITTAGVGYLLNMTGNERLMRNISVACTLIGLALFFLLIPLFGALGATLALAVVLILQNSIAMISAKVRLGFWIYPRFTQESSP